MSSARKMRRAAAKNPPKEPVTLPVDASMADVRRAMGLAAEVAS